MANADTGLLLNIIFNQDWGVLSSTPLVIYHKSLIFLHQGGQNTEKPSD